MSSRRLKEGFSMFWYGGIPVPVGVGRSDGRIKRSSSSHNVIAKHSRQEVRISSPLETQPLLDHQAPRSSSVITYPSPMSYGERTFDERLVQKCSNCGSTKTRGEADINYRIDRLTRQLETLEHTVANDMRLILSLLRQQSGAKSSDSLADSRDHSWLDPNGRSRPSPVRRSCSVPQNDTNLQAQPRAEFQFPVKQRYGILEGTMDATPESASVYAASDKSSVDCADSNENGGNVQDVTRLPYPSPMRHQVIPRRSQSQPVDLSHPPGSQPRVPDESAWLGNHQQERSDAGDGWSGNGNRRRQLLSSRCVSTDETDILDYPPQPQAPIARLDSLQEMESTLASSHASSSTDVQADSKSSQV